MIASTPRDLAALSGSVFAGPFAHWAGTLAFDTDTRRADVMETRCLAQRPLFEDLIDRFAHHHPGDRAGVVSFWSQFYFSSLIIPITIFCLAAERPLPIDFTRLGVRFCPDRGTPLSFHLACGGPVRPGEALVRALYEEQVAAMVATLRRHAGLSARLFWENAGANGTWALGEIARARSPARNAAENLLDDPTWPRAGCAMMRHLKVAAREGRPLARRVCCLRYRLPGVGRCAGICPLSPADM